MSILKSKGKTRKYQISKRRNPMTGRWSNTYIGRLIQKMPHTGFPEQLTVRLRYNLFRAFATSATGQDIYQFRINSLFDPDLTSTGHQPLYRDQLYNIYKYAVVTKASYNLQATTTSTTGQLIQAYMSTYSNTDSDTSANIERGQNKCKMMNAGGNPVKLKGSVNIWQLFGKMKKEDITTDDLYRHDDAANPSQTAYLTIYVQSCGLVTSDISTSITLDLECVFTEPLKISQS